MLTQGRMKASVLAASAVVLLACAGAAYGATDETKYGERDADRVHAFYYLCACAAKARVPNSRCCRRR